jgi:ankyrin repeat protein
VSHLQTSTGNRVWSPEQERLKPAECFADCSWCPRSTLETQNQLVVYLGKDVLSESAGASHDVSQGNAGKDGDDFDDEDDDDAQSGATSNVRSGVSSRNTNTRRFWRSSKKWSRALIIAAANDDINLMKKCLKKSADIEYRSKNGSLSHEGMAAIHVAAEGNKVAALRLLIERGANVNSTIEVTEETPLHLTAQGGFSTATLDLIRSGANLDDQDQYHQTPLLLANDENMEVILLRAGADPRLYNVEAFTALHYAANFGHDEAVKLMLSDRRTNVDARDKLERTALWMACSSNDAERSKIESVVLMLLKAGASPNAESRDDNTTPFCMAVEHGRNSLVRLMLDNSKVDLASHPGSLHVAAGLSNAKVLQTLLPYYRNINARDPTTGDPPLHVAVREGRRNSVAALLEWAKTDLRAGSRSDCLAAIHIAFEQHNLAIVELLLKAHKSRGLPMNPIVNCKEHRGLLPVHFSPTAKHIEAWVRAGLPVNIVDPRKGVPILHYHVLHGEMEVVTALVKHGADITSKDEGGNTAIERLCAEEEVWRSGFQKRLAILRALHNLSPINEVCRANIGKWKDAKLRAAVQGQLPWRTMGETAASLITPGNAMAAVGVVVLGAFGIGRPK